MSLQTASNKRPVEQYNHKAKKRRNNPPVGLVDAKSDAIEGKKTYAYDPHIDPTLQWAGISHTQPIPCSRARRRHSAAVSRRIRRAFAVALSDCPCEAARMICARSTTCCGVDPAHIHCSRRISSASDKTTGRLFRDIRPS